MYIRLEVEPEKTEELEKCFLILKTGEIWQVSAEKDIKQKTVTEQNM